MNIMILQTEKEYVQIWCIGILVIIPPETIKGDQQQLIICPPFGQWFTAHTERQGQH